MVGTVLVAVSFETIRHTVSIEMVIETVSRTVPTSWLVLDLDNFHVEFLDFLLIVLWFVFEHLVVLVDDLF